MDVNPDHVFKLLPSIRNGGDVSKISSLIGPWIGGGGVENNEDVDLMLRDGEKMVLVVENASVVAGMEAMSRRRLAAAIAAPVAAVFADDISDGSILSSCVVM